MNSTPKFIRRKQAAEYLQKIYGTGTTLSLAQYASQGTGPVMHYHGRIPVYVVEDLDAWAQSRISGPIVKASARRKMSEAAE